MMDDFTPYQLDQIAQGPQTNIKGDVYGPVLSGQFHGPIHIGDNTSLYPSTFCQGGESIGRVDVVILTVLPEEYNAVCSKLQNIKRWQGDEKCRNIYAWQSGKIYSPAQKGTYSVVIGMSGRAGTNESTAATLEAIQHWNPYYIFFIGIAGGFFKARKGDIVIADIIHGYEYGKIGDTGFKPRNNWTYQTDQGLFVGALAYASKPDWCRHIQLEPPERYESKVFSGEIASGDKVVDNPDDDFFRHVKEANPKVVAIEMEGAGVGSAIEKAYAQGRRIGFLMIRGISDIPRRKSNSKEIYGTEERDNWKLYASDAVAAFAVGYITDGLPFSPKGNLEPTIIDQYANDSMECGKNYLINKQNKEIQLKYYDVMLKIYDLVNLEILPERYHFYQENQFELRRLYIPLHAWLETNVIKESEKGQYLLRDESNPEDLKSSDGNVDKKRRIAVTMQLGQSRKIIILGDPGSGKSTLIHWIATAYLLRLKNDPNWHNIPNVSTLPNEDLLPIIFECRNLNQRCLEGTLDDILFHALHGLEFTDCECSLLQKILYQRIKEGKALLMVDGLDEISDIGERAKFCKKLERISLVYSEARIILTSRIVGYREIGFRLRGGFEHIELAELTPEEKNYFAQCWCNIVELPEKRDNAARELINSIQSSNRIEHMASNPLMLTTIALVKQIDGHLPRKRSDLLYRAVCVLLEWRREVDKPLKWQDAIPQIEYIAYVMCDRGVQQLGEDEIIKLIIQMRDKFSSLKPNTRNHTPEEFLNLIESRTNLLVKTRYEHKLGIDIAIYGFRHLAFQEYLAAQALVDGCFPGWNPDLQLADCVSSLAGRTTDIVFPELGIDEISVVENWREALRLCTTICDESDADRLICGILTPLKDENDITLRARAIMAMLCISDEPKLSEETVNNVFDVFLDHVNANDGSGNIVTDADAAVMKIISTKWAEQFQLSLERRLNFKPINIKGLIGLLKIIEERGLLEKNRSNLEDFRNDLELIISNGFIIVIAADFTDLFQFCFPFYYFSTNDFNRLTMNESKKYVQDQISRYLMLYHMNNVYYKPIVLLPPYVAEALDFNDRVGRSINYYFDISARREQLIELSTKAIADFKKADFSNGEKVLDFLNTQNLIFLFSQGYSSGMSTFRDLLKKYVCPIPNLGYAKENFSNQYTDAITDIHEKINENKNDELILQFQRTRPSKRIANKRDANAIRYIIELNNYFNNDNIAFFLISSSPHVEGLQKDSKYIIKTAGIDFKLIRSPSFFYAALKVLSNLSKSKKGEIDLDQIDIIDLRSAVISDLEKLNAHLDLYSRIAENVFGQEKRNNLLNEINIINKNINNIDLTLFIDKLSPSIENLTSYLNSEISKSLESIVNAINTDEFTELISNKKLELEKQMAQLMKNDL